MKMYIPELGDSLILSKPFKFTVGWEYRNISLVNLINGRDVWKEFNNIARDFYKSLAGPYNEEASKKRRAELESKQQVFKSSLKLECSIPKGETLKVVRIYIRQGAANFSSVTFTWRPKGGKVVRFWVTLADVNKMEISKHAPGNPVPPPFFG